MGFLEAISTVINAPGIQESLFWLRLVLGAIGIFFIFAIIFLLIKSNWINFTAFDVSTFFTFPGLRLRTTGKRWQEVLARLESANEAEYKLAIMEADTMLVDILKRANIVGDNIEVQLDNVPPTIIPNITDLKNAHSLRNTIVSDPDYRLSQQEARQILEIYENVFRDFGWIQ